MEFLYLILLSKVAVSAEGVLLGQVVHSTDCDR